MDNELQDRDTVREALAEYDEADSVAIIRDLHNPAYVDVLAKAARKWANIHPSRLHGWHILHIKPRSWGLTHPLDCDLTDCLYQTQAETWVDSPAELGNYRWEHEPILESWVRVTEDE